MIYAKIIEDSMAPNGIRLTTMQLAYWRAIHGELMTHRALSRGAMSSRAVPVAKMIEQVRTNPAMTIHWGKNEPGMQAHTELGDYDIQACKLEWLLAAQDAVRHAEALMDAGLAKQVANRLLEPFQWMHTIVTATDWDNLYELRDHADAEPNFQALAKAMRAAQAASEPAARRGTRYSPLAWHLPYVTEQERFQHAANVGLLSKLSAARCARVSYLNHDGTRPEIEKDLALYDRLVGSRPLHSGPVEHQAYPLPLATQRSRNFRGWRHHREMVEFEQQLAAAA
jgi:hypothetical protein